MRRTSVAHRTRPRPAKGLCAWRVGRGGLAVLIAAAVFGVSAGCGYTGREPFPERFSSVAVPIFENATFERGVEFDLTEALTKELRSRTPYAVRRSASAQTTIEGEITHVARDMLSRREVGGVPQEVEVSVTVDFAWVDARTGETILERRGFTAVGRHIPTAPVSEPAEVAKREAVQRLARDIVTELRADWSSP